MIKSFVLNTVNLSGVPAFLLCGSVGEKAMNTANWGEHSISKKEYPTLKSGEDSMFNFHPLPNLGQPPSHMKHKNPGLI